MTRRKNDTQARAKTTAGRGSVNAVAARGTKAAARDLPARKTVTAGRKAGKPQQEF
jgi:hypothetical protein